MAIAKFFALMQTQLTNCCNNFNQIEHYQRVVLQYYSHFKNIARDSDFFFQKKRNLFGQTIVFLPPDKPGIYKPP